ncbi:MAG: hypothetical protein CPDRYMAC_5882 [uncultured Paraburkholderia sp.]|nr:MAG: hypothetical protein CPDRYMAC_5882 [uncultured Paraburkholderia sp.]
MLDRLAECGVVHTAYYLIQALEHFIQADPAGVFRLIVKSVMTSSRFGYAFESMGADVIVRVVEKYLADYPGRVPRRCAAGRTHGVPQSVRQRRLASRPVPDFPARRNLALDCEATSVARAINGLSTFLAMASNAT